MKAICGPNLHATSDAVSSIEELAQKYLVMSRNPVEMSSPAGEDYG